MGMALSMPIDWAFTPLCVAVVNQQTEWNGEMDDRIFIETEVDFVLNMIKTNFDSYRMTEQILPFYTKALATLKALMEEQGLEECFGKFQTLYQETTIENTLKMLLRCKLVFTARVAWIHIFELIGKYFALTDEARRALGEQKKYKLPQREINELKLRCGRVYNAAEKV